MGEIVQQERGRVMVKKGKINKDSLAIAFVQGARWMMWKEKNATLFPSEKENAFKAAKELERDGRLGVNPWLDRSYGKKGGE